MAGQTPTYRQQQAQATKDRIVAAARALMAEHGWSGTTIDAIAAAAGVAPQTVYGAFGNKRELLTGMRQVMLRESQIPELMAQAEAEPDPASRLDLAARWTRQQMQTSYDVISIHRQAARSDPEVAAAYRKVLDSRGKALGGFVRGLRDALPPGLDVRGATDLLWALSNEELYRELVVERGWSADRYEAWLASTLKAQLLGRG